MKTLQQLRAEPPALGAAYTLASPRVRPLTPIQLRVRDAIRAADQPADYEHVDCLCGASPDDVVLAQAERHGLPYRKVVCRACGLLRVSPRWTTKRYASFYEHEYRDLYNPVVGSKEEFARKQAQSPWLHELAAWIVAGYTRFGGKPTPRIVEIGAGGGWNLGLLPAAWERIGYDVDREYLAIGERLFSCTMRFGLVADALDDLAGADIVLLSHVVEHFSNPVEELRRIGQALAPASLLFIEVPGIFRIHRTNLDVMSYMQNAHTFTFCATTLRAICERAGLEVLAGDETARLICRPGLGQQPARSGPPSATLAPTIVRYLRRCEGGYRTLRTLGQTPLLGHYLAAGWRRVYFPLLGATAGPKQPIRL